MKTPSTFSVLFLQIWYNLRRWKEVGLKDLKKDYVIWKYSKEYVTIRWGWACVKGFFQMMWHIGNCTGNFIQRREFIFQCLIIKSLKVTLNWPILLNTLLFLYFECKKCKRFTSIACHKFYNFVSLTYPISNYCGTQ